MNTSVSLVSSYILTLMLAAGLSACSSSSSRPDETAAAAPESRAGTIVAAQSDDAASRQRAAAQSIKTNHPRTYTVKRGDTLWDIASLFLKDPWYWPEIWFDNPQVENPHLIYPGDILTLIYVDGMPRIIRGRPTHAVDAAAAPMPVVKMSPSVRRDTLEASIKSIPGDAIRQFLSKPRVVTKEIADNAPYIVGSDDEHLIMGQGDRIYVRGEIDKERVRYTVYRPGTELVDPVSGEVLGYEGIYAGEAHISKYGDPATGKLTFTEREVLLGDRLLPTDKSKIDNLYFPRVPDSKIVGLIIHLSDALFGVAKFQIAVINLGDRDGIETGHLLATYAKGEQIKDRYDRTGEFDDIDLPEQRSGLMMIFRTFDHVSYGLIMESTRVIHKYDIVKTPE